MSGRANIPQVGRIQPPPGPVEGAAAPRRSTLRLPDGYETSVFVHDPPGRSAGAPVVYLHGIQSHPGWFFGSAAALAVGGRMVFQVTRRGSGDNRRARGDARSAGQLLRDVQAACEFAGKCAGAGRVHLVGVSWGGKLAACFAAWPHRSVETASLTMIAPGIVPQVDVAVRTKLAVAASLLCCPRRQFDIPLGDVSLFTDNEPMRRYLRRDPCRLHRATARFLYASRRLDRMLGRLQAGALNVPATLILAGRDRIIDNAATRELLSRRLGDRLDVVELPGAHTLEFEPDPTPLHEALARSTAGGRLSYEAPEA